MAEPGAAAARPFPAQVDPAFAGFLAGLAERRLTVRQCSGCGQVQWPPRLLCARCHGDEFRPSAASEHGNVHTFTVCYRGFDPWFAARLPYAVAVVDVGAGVRLTGSYLGDDLGRLRCGLPVRADYEISGGHAYLGWRPVAAERG